MPVRVCNAARLHPPPSHPTAYAATVASESVPLSASRPVRNHAHGACLCHTSQWWFPQALGLFADCLGEQASEELKSALLPVALNAISGRAASFPNFVRQPHSHRLRCRPLTPCMLGHRIARFAAC